MLLFLGQLSFAQDTETAITKSFNPDGSTSIVFEFRHSDIKSNPNKDGSDIITVEMAIKANVSETTLNQLAKAGRYKLEGKKTDDGQYVIIAPNLDKAVTIGGQDLIDEVVVLVRMPGGAYAVNGKELTSTLAARDENGNKVKLGIKQQIEVGKLRFIPSSKPIDVQPGKQGYVEVLIDGEPLHME